ncbi:MAG: hypothetical protein IK076_04995 [Bacteroidales bacterium]|nr:hypothetical protein [Bacteroidales bacterium]
MKKIILLAVLCCLAGSAMAQEERGYFDKMAVGLQVGTAGLGIEMAVPVGPNLEMRAGYSFLPPFSFTKTVSVPEHPGEQGSAKGESIPVDVKATSHISDAQLLLDIFPAKDGIFRFTVGLLAGPKDVVKVTNTTRLPDDYNTFGLGIDDGEDDYSVRAVNNYISGYIGSHTLRPYAGIGLGRAIRPEKRLSFSCDLGAMFWGTPGLFAPGESIFGDWKDVRITTEAAAGKDEGLIKIAEKVVLYPMINLHLFYTIF